MLIKRTSTSGFSLNELLIAIALIAVLAAFLVGGISSAKKASRRTQSIANLKAIGGASLIFAVDHNGHLPPSGNLVQKDRIIGYAVSAGIRCPITHLFTSKYPLGRGSADLATPDQFCNPNGRNYKDRKAQDFFYTGANSGQISYLYYYNARKSINPAEISDVYYNDTIREHPRSVIYSEFCLSVRGLDGSNEPTCAAFLLNGEVRIFQQNEISKKKSWKEVLEYFAN